MKDGEAKTSLTSLIEDFHCVNADDMDSQVLAARMRQIKNSEEEMSNMCRAMEEYAEEYAKEYAEEYAKKKDDERSEGIALDMMADNESLDKILKYSRLAIDRIQELATKNGYTLVNV